MEKLDGNERPALGVLDASITTIQLMDSTMVLGDDLINEAT